MEESITTVETNPQKPPENLPASFPSQSPVSTFTKVDNNLTGIGFFTASSKRSRKAIEKTTVVVDQGVERHISILPSAKYGLPITQDQDYWLALMKLVTEQLQREGKLANPFTFTTAQLRHILGQVNSGKNYKAVNEWLSVMNSTAIEGGSYNAARKSWYTEKTHAVDRVITVGKQLPDGTIADRNHIWFSQWQLDNINAGNLIAVELATYTQLENNISKNLVPHLQEWLYASQRDGRFEKQYEDVCQLLGIRVYKYRSDVERQLRPSLDELVTHGYLSKWAIEPMADRKHYKLVLWHGPKYHSDRQARLDKKSRFETLSAGESAPAPARRPRQRPLILKPEPTAEPQPAVVFDYRVIHELQKRGVGEADARTLIVKLLPGQPILDQLEYLDLRIQQARGTRKEIKNEPGFYIERLRANVSIPATFETTAAREARQQAELAQQQTRQEAAEKRLAEESALRQAVDDELDRLKDQNPERYQALYDQAKTELYRDMPMMARRPDSAVHDGAIRARMRQFLEVPPSQGELPMQTEPRPAEPAAALIDTTVIEKFQHYATNEPPRQADRLPDVFNLETILTTLQLPQPAEPAETVERPEKLRDELL